jgi:hypothetical protein
MPTAEQCRAYAADYHHLGQEADVSIQRALGWNWEEPVPKKRTSTPMEVQPVSGPRLDDAISMGSSPSKKPKRSGRLPQSASLHANAETSRRSSLRNQRSQMETIRTRKGR